MSLPMSTHDTNRARGTPPLKGDRGPSGARPPGKIRADGRGVFVLGQAFRQSVFRGRAAHLRLRGRPDAPAVREGLRRRPPPSPPIYLWLRKHAGKPTRCPCISACMARLEFMPGKQAGLGARETGPTG